MGESVPLADVDTVFVQKQTNVGQESLLEALILGVVQRADTRLRTSEKMKLHASD